MKLKLIFLTIIVLINLKIISQNNNRLSIEITFSPEMAGVHIFSINNKKYSSLFKNVNIQKFGFTTGLNLNYRYNKSISIQTGLQVSNKGFRQKKTQLISIDPNDPAIPEFVKSKFTDYYLEIPLSIYFKHQEDEKFNSEIGLGFSLGYKVYSKDIYLLFYKDKTETTYYKRKMFEHNVLTSNILLSFKTQYHVNKKYKIIAEPIFRYLFFNSNNPKFNPPIFTHYYNLGANLGIAYTL